MENRFLPPELADRVSPEQAAALKTYAAMLREWNSRFNLAGVKPGSELELCLDSFYLADFLESLFPGADSSLRIWDLGAGAGLPGIPLRIFWNKGQLTLVEAREKRALFIANALAKLRLANIGVFRGRVEKFFENSGKAHCIFSRAFMPWQKMTAFCSPYLLATGLLIVMANEAPGSLPQGWHLAASMSYQARNKEHWLWALGCDI